MREEFAFVCLFAHSRVRKISSLYNSRPIVLCERQKINVFFIFVAQNTLRNRSNITNECAKNQMNRNFFSHLSLSLCAMKKYSAEN
jgi:hypothetical protein